MPVKNVYFNGRLFLHINRGMCDSARIVYARCFTASHLHTLSARRIASHNPKPQRYVVGRFVA